MRNTAEAPRAAWEVWSNREKFWNLYVYILTFDEQQVDLWKWTSETGVLNQQYVELKVKHLIANYWIDCRTLRNLPNKGNHLFLVAFKNLQMKNWFNF